MVLNGRQGEKKKKKEIMECEYRMFCILGHRYNDEGFARKDDEPVSCLWRRNLRAASKRETSPWMILARRMVGMVSGFSDSFLCCCHEAAG